jgi:hypothetical protein
MPVNTHPIAFSTHASPVLRSGVELSAMFRRLAAAIGGLLVLFHLWLFGSQLLDGRLTELGQVLRWLMAAGLVAAMAHLHRRGLSLFKGRRAIAIWLLAALLHGPAMAGAGSTYQSPALAEVVTTLVQIAASVALGLGLALLGGMLRRQFSPRLVIARAVGRRRTRPFDPGRSLSSASRPPPSLASLAF